MDESNRFRKLVSNPLVHAILVYISGAWIILEMVDYFIKHYSLADQARVILLIILLAGLPVAVFLTWFFRGDKQEEEERARKLSRVLRKRLWFTIPGAVILLLGFLTIARALYNNSDHKEIVLAPYSSLELLMRDADNEISLAVLPFSNLTGDLGLEWIVAGQQETLITELSKISRLKPLRIISRHTVDSFKNKNASIPEMARGLDVDYLIEASVLGTSDSVTMQLRLVEVSPRENVVWAQSCSSDIGKMLKMHFDIAQQIAVEMDMDISPAELNFIREDRMVNPDAYRAYMKGMYYLNQYTFEATEKGLEYFHEAIRIDPQEPFAYAGLSLAYQEIGHSPMDPGDALEKAEAAARQAISLDSTMPEVYSAMAETYLYRLWDFEKAEEYFLKALELNNNLSITHYHYSWALYLWGRMEEAIVEHKLARKYDPFNPKNTAWLAALYTFDGRHELALKTVQEAFEINDDYIIGHFVNGMAYLGLGEHQKAIESHERVYELMPMWSWPLMRTYFVTGHKEEFMKLFKELQKRPDSNFTALGRAIGYSLLGNEEEALRWLNYEPHHAWAAWSAVMPTYDKLREFPGYQDYLERLHLPE